MPELMDKFDALYAQYQAQVPHACYTATDRRGLYRQIPDTPGVYVVFRKTQDKPVYIGCAGKIVRGLGVAGQTLRARIRDGWLPRAFDDCGFQYDPFGNTSRRGTTRYHHSIALSEIRLCVLQTPVVLAPATLEHLLIQSVRNQYHDLPDANQEV